MKKITRWIVSLVVIAIGFGGLSVASPTPVAAAGTCTSTFLTFPAWYDGLLDTSTCEIASPDTLDQNGDGLSQFIFRIVLNIIEIALQLVAYLAAGFIIYGGFKYLTSAGDSGRITSGRKIITNALVGLIISFTSIGVVNLVSTNVGLNGTSQACAAAGNDIKIDANCAGVAKVDAGKALEGVLNTAYFVSGIIAVIVIIISGFFYTTSNGDANKTKRAKDGILYAIVGLALIFVAFIITNFVIGRF